MIESIIRDLERQRSQLDVTIRQLREVAAAQRRARKRPANGRWTAEEMATLRRLVYVEGKTHEEAAKVLGRTRTSVAKQLSRWRRAHV